MDGTCICKNVVATGTLTFELGPGNAYWTTSIYNIPADSYVTIANYNSNQYYNVASDNVDFDMILLLNGDNLDYVYTRVYYMKNGGTLELRCRNRYGTLSYMVTN